MYDSPEPSYDSAERYEECLRDFAQQLMHIPLAAECFGVPSQKISAEEDPSDSFSFRITIPQEAGKNIMRLIIRYSTGSIKNITYHPLGRQVTERREIIEIREDVVCLVCERLLPENREYIGLLLRRAYEEWREEMVIAGDDIEELRQGYADCFTRIIGRVPDDLS